MKRNSKTFILWEMLALFMMLSYQGVQDLIDTSTTINTSLGIIIELLWIIFALLFVALGILSLPRR